MTHLLAWRQSAVALRVSIVNVMVVADPTVKAELEAWAIYGTIPVRAQAVYDSLPLADRVAASKLDTLQRNSPLVTAFAGFFGYDTPEKVDQLFLDALALESN